ncbi:MAG: DnaJ domain-containing protein [Myxococcales bacterium]
MGWSGRTLGGSLSNVYAGPRSAQAGPGIGHLFEDAQAEPWPVDLERLSWNRCMGPSGPGMLVTAELAPARAVPRNAELHFWLQYDEESYAEALHDDFADSDGDLCAVGEIVERDAQLARAMLYLPWAATPPLKGDCLCQLSLVAGDAVLGNQWFELDLPGRATREIHSAMGALAYCAAALLGTAREPSQAELAATATALTGLFALDELGRAVALELLDRAVRQAPDFEKALRLVLDEIEPPNRPEVLRLLGGIARDRGQASGPEAAFIRRLADAIGLAAPNAQSAGDTLAAAWRTLELEPGAGLDQVRAAWRRLALDYHPDKVQTLAVGFREYATARMQQLNEAYEILKKHLGSPKR